MNFEDYTFGFADADKEFSRIDNYFNEIFFDPKGHLTKLLTGWEFLVVGRKGVGKSAYSAKLRSMQSSNLYTEYLPLNEFEYSTFEKTSTDKNITGTQKFKDSWDFVLLCLIYKTLVNALDITEVESVNNVLSILKKLGFPLEFDYKQVVTSLSKLKLGANLSVFDVAYEKEFGVKPITYIERISALSELMMRSLENIYLGDKKIYLLLDGVDDVLRFKKNRIEILSSLVRSVDYLNSKLSGMKVAIKIVLFIRDDVLFLINDTDINKVKRDSSLKIDWTKNTDDLKEMVILRMIFSGDNREQAESALSLMFPHVIKDIDSWKYILGLTLYKPRDIIQFFKCCQELYPQKNSLTYSEINEVSKYYSNQYFMGEMKNELAGFVIDEVIAALPIVFKKIYTKSFSCGEFFTALSEQLASTNYTIEDAKYLLSLLYESGYIGQIIVTSRNWKGSVQFKHRNPTSMIDYNYNFLIHKGLSIGLGLRK